jgi:hypothetical protein
MSNWVPKHKSIFQFTASNSDDRLCLGLTFEAFTIAIPSAVELYMTEYGVQDSLEIGLVFVNSFEGISDVAINHDGQLKT